MVQQKLHHRTQRVTGELEWVTGRPIIAQAALAYKQRWALAATNVARNLLRKVGLTEGSAQRVDM